MILGEIGRKLGVITRATLRHLRRSPTGAALLRAVHQTALSLGCVFHQLWLEVTGFTFLVLAAIGALAGFREYVKLHAGQAASLGRLFIAIAFTLCFAWFGVSSFWRVNKNVARRRESRPGSQLG